MESAFKFSVGHFPILHCFTEVLSDFSSDPLVDLAFHQLLAERCPRSSVNILVLGSAHLVPEMEDLLGLRTRYATAFVWTHGKARHIHWHAGWAHGACLITSWATGVGTVRSSGWGAVACTLTVWATGVGILSSTGWGAGA